MPATNSIDHLHVLRVELARLANIQPTNLSDPIPHIDGWTVHSTVGHTGWVLQYVTEALKSDPENPPSRSQIPEPPADEGVLDWFNQAQKTLVAEIEATDPNKRCPSFAGDQPSSWWLRRMAHEVSMHRWDSYSAFSSPEPIDSALARDGIDEVLQIFVPARLQLDKLSDEGETLHLHATDIDDGEWMIDLRSDGVKWERAHAKGDAAVRGPVSDLLLLLWSRIPPSRLDVFGDAAILERWQSAASF